MSDITVKIVGVESHQWSHAADLARKFDIEFPDRFGLADGVGYRYPLFGPMYVYRLKSMIVVRGSK